MGVTTRANLLGYIHYERAHRGAICGGYVMLVAHLLCQSCGEEPHGVDQTDGEPLRLGQVSGFLGVQTVRVCGWVQRVGGDGWLKEWVDRVC